MKRLNDKQKLKQRFHENYDIVMENRRFLNESEILFFLKLTGEVRKRNIIDISPKRHDRLNKIASRFKNKREPSK